ncbi:MAG: CRISPR-associated endonuclease Cas2 [Erysipelotrichaceae bacterium]|nr:CRISPR-associated endonuclease Cas2 [Erysipelotrichaceae bacterium]
MSYRYMRVIVMFDLPIKTSSEIREYTKFRKYLMKNGFMMMQKSVYCKLALNMSVVESIVNTVRANKPPVGLVQIFTLTEKQFSRIEFLVGEISSSVLNTDSRLVIL